MVLKKIQDLDEKGEHFEIIMPIKHFWNANKALRMQFGQKSN